MDISLGQNTMYHFIHPSIKGQIKIKNNTKVLGRQPEPENHPRGAVRVKIVELATNPLVVKRTA